MNFVQNSPQIAFHNRKVTWHLAPTILSWLDSIILLAPTNASKAYNFIQKDFETISGSDPQSTQQYPKNPLDPQNHQPNPKSRTHNPYEI